MGKGVFQRTQGRQRPSLLRAVRGGCPGLAHHPLMPQDPPRRHSEGHAEPLRDGPIGEPLLAQLVGALVEVDALASHGLTLPARKRGEAGRDSPSQFTGAVIPEMLQRE